VARAGVTASKSLYKFNIKGDSRSEDVVFRFEEGSEVAGEVGTDMEGVLLHY